MHTSELCWID